MTGRDIYNRVAELRRRLASDHSLNNAELHDEILSLIEGIADHLSERDHSKTVLLRTTPDGETFDV